MHKNTHAQPRTFAAFTLGLCWGKCHSVERMFIWRGQIWWLGVAAASPFPFPWRNVRLCACACVFLTVMCVVFDWHGTMGDASVPRSAQPDVHRIWHCRASGVTGMWQGRAGPKWLFRLHYPAKTLDMPSPISHFPFMVTEPFTIHKWSADCTLPFTQYRLITHRCKLARTDKTTPHHWKLKRGAERVAECRERASSSGDYPEGSITRWYLHCHSTLWCFDTGGL